MIITTLFLILFVGLHTAQVDDSSCRERLKKECQEGTVQSELICQLLSQGIKERGYSLFAFLNTSQTIKDETLRENIVCARLMGYKEFRNVPVFLHVRSDFLQGEFFIPGKSDTKYISEYVDLDNLENINLNFSDPKLHKLYVKVRELQILDKNNKLGKVFDLSKYSFMNFSGGRCRCLSLFFISFRGDVIKVSIPSSGRCDVYVNDVKVIDIYGINPKSKELVYVLKNGNYSKMFATLNGELKKAYE